MSGPNLIPNASSAPLLNWLIESESTRLRMKYPKLISRIRMVVKCACGIRPPRISPGSRLSMARGPTCTPQYGHVRSLLVMKARQLGHMRRLSTCVSFSFDRHRRRVFPDKVVLVGLALDRQPDRECQPQKELQDVE